MTADSSGRPALRALVAFTPLAGTLAFPLVVPLLMLRYNLTVGLIGAVLIGTLWFVAMLRTSEMPGHS
jgi:hypothetical protein